MPQRTTSEADTARALNISTKSLQRYRNRKDDPIPHTLIQGRPFYDVEESRAWMERAGLTGDKTGATPGAKPPDDKPPSDDTFREATGRAAESRARALRAGQLARASAAEQERRKALPDRGHGRKLALVQTLEQLFEVDRAFAVDVADGHIPKDVADQWNARVNSLRQLFRQRSKAPAVDHDAVVMLTPETVAMAEVFEGISDPARRARVRAFLDAVAEEDRLAGPCADTGEPGTTANEGAA